ncbi:MAG: peptidase [Candidatus Altiarchaeales archaeon ex4484_43]|nr:MAG: peptidase [Candidatus Altiarchaeales archaeon ex4484_43]
MELQIFYTKNCKGFLKPVQEILEGVYGLKTFGNKPLELIENAYNPKRNQYDATSLLDYLIRTKEGKIALWIINNDIYCEGMNFVFGYAAFHHGAVLSVFRLDSLELIQKEAVHEVGHVLGLGHCDNECVMQFSNSLQEAKEKPMKVCEKCRKLIKLE